MSTQDNFTLDVKALAALLHLSPATVRSDVSRRPWTLPPFIKVGTKTVWLLETVIGWLKARERVATPPVTPAPPPRRRGRPTKADQVRQQHSAAAAEKVSA